LWETLFLLPRWMACLLTVGDFPFQGDRSAEPRSSVACNSILDFSGAAMFVASRGMPVLLAKCQTCLSATMGILSLYSRLTPFQAQTALNFQLSPVVIPSAVQLMTALSSPDLRQRLKADACEVGSVP